MRDPNFQRAVVLLCQHNEEGALGVVINRAGPVAVEEVLEGMSLARGRFSTTPTWWGGPVGRDTGFVIWRGEVSGEEGWTLGGEIAVSPSVDRLTALVERGEAFHLCLGYAGWSPEQLDQEIARGSWLYSDPDPSVVFDVPLDARYDLALALLGLKADAVWMQPIDE